AVAARTFYVVDTLEYLKRGGRLSSTQALIGGVMRVKPILTTVDGRVEVTDRSRTWSRALERLTELAVGAAVGAADARVDVVVSHGLAPERAEQLEQTLRERLDIRELFRTRVGPVMGTHTGPGSLGVAVVASDA
ncbi:MAG TPA: DegV family protein, partial [Nitriliruptorales bacterium]